MRDPGFLYQRFPERAEHGSETDDKAGTETDADENAMVSLRLFLKEPAFKTIGGANCA